MVRMAFSFFLLALAGSSCLRGVDGAGNLLSRAGLVKEPLRRSVTAFGKQAVVAEHFLPRRSLGAPSRYASSTGATDVDKSQINSGNDIDFFYRF